MIKRLARWVLRDELEPAILPPAKVMMSLKRIFYNEAKNAGMAYANAIKITDKYRLDYDRCIDTCADIRCDLAEMPLKD